MRTRAAHGSFLDPRTKILIWLLANVVVFTWTPAVFRVAVMLAYFSLFLLERKGKMLVGLLLVYLVIVAVQFWLLPLLPGSLATVFATVTYFILVFPCIAGGLTSLPLPASASLWPLWSGWGRPGAFPSLWR